MKSVKSPNTKTQLCRVGNYQMTGRVLGKGHFARVEEATHRLLGKTVAVKVLDSSCIQEEYARRNIHREPRVLARLRHPCIAMLYETMICGSRLYLVLEACAGGDLCSLVLQQRERTRGLPEARARRLAAHIVNAVRHMHACGVVHRDLKMENIMLDSTKQLIKIVDFGLSNVWEPGCILRTPCGSLEYAAPELFAESRRYGPEVDMWSVGVIVFGMMTGGLPFSMAGASGDRPHFSQIIAKGIGRRHTLALAHVSPECREFIKMLLQPEPRARLTAECAAGEPWLRRANLHQLTYSTDTASVYSLHPAANREIYKQIADSNGMRFSEVVAQIRAEPYGPIGGIFNMKSHQLLLQASRRDLRPHSAQSAAPPPVHTAPPNDNQHSHHRNPSFSSRSLESKYPIKAIRKVEKKTGIKPSEREERRQLASITESQVALYDRSKESKLPVGKSTVRRVSPRLAKEQIGKYQTGNASASSKVNDFYRRAGDCIPSWRPNCVYVKDNTDNKGSVNISSIKRAPISPPTQKMSPTSSISSQSKSDRSPIAIPNGWTAPKEYLNLRRLRR